MTTIKSEPGRKSGAIKKAVFGAILGALCGYFGMRFFMESGNGNVLDGGGVALGAIGLVYMLTGLFVGIGATFPALGARVLNVEDRGELEENRIIHVAGGFANALMGLSLVILPFAAPDGPVAPIVAIGLIAVAIVALIAANLRLWSLYDELWRQVSAEGAALSFKLFLPALTLWAACVHVGWMAMFDPLGVVALAMAILLIATLYACGRHGMLRLH